MRNRLCVTCDEAAAGYLKASQASVLPKSKIIPLPVSLIRAPVVGSNLGDINSEQVLTSLTQKMEEVLQYWRDADQVELYIDPDSNSQLLMVYLLSQALTTDIDHTNLSIFQGVTPWGQQSPQTQSSSGATLISVENQHLTAAAAIWLAYSASTPHAWLHLSIDELRHFPFMTRTREALLDDLPSAQTGLGACERLVLNTLATGGCTVGEIARNCADDPLPLLELPSIIDLITNLASGASPLIAGLKGRLRSTDFFNDAHAWDRYAGSHLRLTADGHKINVGEIDFIETCGVDRWWGGTRLVGQTSWRWEKQARALIPPES
ncbi:MULTISPECIES: hypothetical protein [Agrobacterium]|uniref:hypothetical protein n=1 Tax=Agrobacterium TaxID=357 RepID=UPI0022C6ACBC|nr:MULTISPECIES: hypothetical protein [Agrobacterium]MCZ7866345.1 hypothetical protein [Agrobacterium salinitolerans]MDA5641506.1 hypothetical protein [Agrobacterium sp. ST15.13.013]MDA7001707.1 hypothetical protein [Agrobacterium salinitolerans]